MTNPRLGVFSIFLRPDGGHHSDGVPHHPGWVFSLAFLLELASMGDTIGMVSPIT